MTLTVTDLVAQAKALVPDVDAAEAQRLIAEEGALLLDVRDAPELQMQGRATPAHHIPRGMLEFRADPTSKLHDPELRRDRPIVLFCAAGGRAALAGQTLRLMGYARVYNLGGFMEWKAAGGAVIEPVDRGMT